VKGTLPEDARAVSFTRYFTDVLTRIVNGHPNSDIDLLPPWATESKTSGRGLRTTLTIERVIHAADLTLDVMLLVDVIRPPPTCLPVWNNSRTGLLLAGRFHFELF
jgi:hypothetical protein